MNMYLKGLVRCKNCGGVVSTDINVHSAKKKGGEKIVYKYLFCPQCGGYRTREENGVEKVKEALKTLKNMPKSVVEKLVACLDEEIYKDHKMEIEAKKALDRQIAGFAEKGKPVDRLVYGRQYYTGFIYQKTNRVQTG